MVNKGSGQVRSLTRALSILKTLAGSPYGMSLTELSDATGLPPSTTHRLLTTLEAERFVRPDGPGGLWRVGVSAFYVGSAFARTRDVTAQVRPYLRRLMEQSGETANLFVLSDQDAVCIGQIESRHAMRAITGVGGRVQLHSSAAGKVLMAFGPDSLVDQIAVPGQLPRETPHTITKPADLRTSVDQVRQDGYAVDDEEHAIGMRCVAAPVFNEFGEIAAAISVSGPSARVSESRVEALGKLVTEIAREATRDFGGTAPV